MTVASLGFAVDSSQAVAAKTNLDNMSAASAKAEAAQKRLSSTSSASNAALTKIAAGVEQANATLVKLASIAEGSNASLVKLVATAEKTNTTLATIGTGSTQVVSGIGKVAPAADKSTKALNDNANAARLTSNQMLNLSRQGNDVITMFALGASPVQIFASQIGQVYDALESGPRGLRGSLSAIGATAKSAGQALLAFMVTPAGLAAGAGVAAVAGLATYIISTRKEVKSLDDLLKDHASVLRGIGDIYGSIADKAKSAFSVSNLNGLQLLSSSTQAGLKIQIANQTQSAMSDLGRFVNPGKSAGGFFSTAGEFKPFSDAIDYLRKTAREGTPDIIGFRKIVEDKWALDPNNAALTASAGKLIDLTKDADAAARALKQLEIAQEALAKSVGPGGLPLRRGALSTEDMGAYERYKAAGSVSADRAQQAFDAQRQGLYARSPAELAAAARAQAGAQYNDNENPAERARRIDMAGQQAALAAQHALDEAQKDRKRSLDQTLASQQLDLDLIGKTTGAAEAMRMQFQLTQQLREEAARNNVPVDQQELELIKQKADAYGKMADQIARAQLGNDLAFERSQQFLSAGEQQIASRLRNTGIGMDSPEAQQMRDMAKFADAKGLAVGFLTDFKSELLRNGGDVGKALGTSILNALTKSMDDQLGKIFDTMATWLASAITGQRPGVGGAAFGTAGGFADMIFGSASNDNYAPGAVTRAPLAAVGGNMAAYAAAIRSIESAGSGGYSALGPVLKNGNQALGAYQVMKSNLPSWSQDALGKTLSPSQFLADPAAQDAIFEKQFGKYLTKYGNPQDAASAWFTGGPLSTGAKAKDVLGTSGSVYVDKFNAAVAKASDSLGGLDQTVTNTVQSLAGSIGGQGGLASILDGLKPGNFQANTTLSDILGYSGVGTSAGGSSGGGFLGAILGFLPKLFGFADGTESAPSGWAWVGERGPELRKLRAGDVIRNNPRSMQMAAQNNNGSPPVTPKIDLHVHVTGASGDDHIRTLSRQGAQEAISEYHQGQINGGFGETQRRYTSQKG
ncbi:phage tail length tape measure family protein [Mesorhizobium sp. 2RAF45]|uniref:phage tail length tape measure family protein n=1 Tax=Mesorhizobium sp. 2RAF45 TaxID=3233001 RepID=UPI003F9DD94F